jgi:hypothetical protein
MRRAAAALETAQVAPAMLGCIEAALQDLLWASAAFELASARSTSGDRAAAAGAKTRPLVERMRRGYASLQEALVDAERAAAAAWPLVARALAAGTAAPGDSEAAE